MNADFSSPSDAAADAVAGLAPAAAATPEAPAPMTNAQEQTRSALPEPEDYAARAERKREEALEFAKSATWNGKALQPWSRERETILSRLEAFDKLPIRPLDELVTLSAYIEEEHENGRGLDITLERICDLDVYFPSAAKLLFIASHTKDRLCDLRTNPKRFLLEVDEWAESNIGADQVEAACFAAQKIRYAYQTALALARPNKYSHRTEDAGN
jgi:hypothetical protein